MRNYPSLICLCLVLLLGSCAPIVTTKITKKYPTLDYREVVVVYGVNEETPSNSEVIGFVRIADSGFTTDCNWNVVVEKAKLEARKAGGNAIKITLHQPPSMLGSTCHSITATILRTESSFSKPNSISSDSMKHDTKIGSNYVLLHVYRLNEQGPLIGYDLHLGDSAIFMVGKQSLKTIRISHEGPIKLWAKTDSRSEISLNVRKGSEYYIRCAISGISKRPVLELIDSNTGRREFQSINTNEANKHIVIELIDGTRIDCIFSHETDEMIYYSVFRKEKEIQTFLNKKDIKNIYRNE